jgi:hypothetical protein
MDPEYVFRELPSEVWAIEYTNVYGDRVVDVLGTEYAARAVADHYAIAAPTAAPALLCTRTDFQPVPSNPGSQYLSKARKAGPFKRYRTRFGAYRRKQPV